MRAETTGSRVRAVSAAGSAMTVRAAGWRETSRAAPIPRPVDSTVSGVASELRFPPVFVRIVALDGDDRYELGGDTGPISLPPATYLVRLDGSVLTYVRFSGPASVEKPSGRDAVVSFPEPTQVTLGFRSRVGSPPDTVTVPRTPEGVAAALSAMTAGNRTTTADRSLPTMRGHPPLVEFGDGVEVPEAIDRERRETDVELTVPPDLDYLLPAASLVHYLGARVQIGEGAPTLRAATRTHRFERLPSFQRETASLLRRVFSLDCLVRNAGPHRTDLAEARHLPALGLDAEALYDATPGARVAAYLDAPFERVSDDLPEWHLSMYVEPTYRHVRTLPYLLGNVPHLLLPESEPLETRERLTRSLDDFYRFADDVPEIELDSPTLGPGRTHGWLSDGIPIDVFKALPAAYENRQRYLDRAGDPVSIVVVRNEDAMATESDDAVAIYRNWEFDGPTEVTVRERLTRRELADVLESPHDFVHYIGHCETDGLRCVDGHLPVSELSESNVQAFFLNACGSYYEGLDLVRKGSVAGAVTFDTVLDTPATRVGTIFGRLLIAGFSIERALDLARRRIIMGKDYAVVGDGTHTLAQSETHVPALARIERTEDHYRIQYDVASPRVAGGYYQPYLTGDRRSHLYGSPHEFDLSYRELRSFLEDRDVPVIYDGDIQWSGELYDRLV